MVGTTLNGGPMKSMLAISAAFASALAIAGLARATEGSAAGEASAGAAATQTLTVRSSRYGRILFDGRGRVVYGFTRDRRGGPSRCYGACAKAWPVYLAKGTVVRAGAGVKKSLIGTTRRSDGRRQYTYRGWPLYYYAHEGPGEVLCQNVSEFGGLWLVVRPDGRLVR
jgi:predicted lipoprotein with Yx(FWY)xxD motif